MLPVTRSRLFVSIARVEPLVGSPCRVHDNRGASLGLDVPQGSLILLYFKFGVSILALFIGGVFFEGLWCISGVDEYLSNPHTIVYLF
jgi:hypothetical protein